MAQIAADATELPYEKITVHHGSTSHVKDGYGAYHSRSTVMGGSAILLAAEKLKDLIRETAAARFGCTPAEIAIDGEQVGFSVRTCHWRDLSDVPLEVEASFFNKKYTWAYGTQAAHVAVDPGTGHVKVLDYLSVEDVGRIINPLTLHGQAIGSIVQGLGGAFLEHLVYDENGQLLTGSFADYLMPTASDFPHIRSITLELKPCPEQSARRQGRRARGALSRSEASWPTQLPMPCRISMCSQWNCRCRRRASGNWSRTLARSTRIWTGPLASFWYCELDARAVIVAAWQGELSRGTSQQ